MQPADQEVLADYIQALVELGFVESHRWENNAGDNDHRSGKQPD